MWWGVHRQPADRRKEILWVYWRWIRWGSVSLTSDCDMNLRPRTVFIDIKPRQWANDMLLNTEQPAINYLWGTQVVQCNESRKMNRKRWKHHLDLVRDSVWCVSAEWHGDSVVHILIVDKKHTCGHHGCVRKVRRYKNWKYTAKQLGIQMPWLCSHNFRWKNI